MKIRLINISLILSFCLLSLSCDKGESSTYPVGMVAITSQANLSPPAGLWLLGAGYSSGQEWTVVEDLGDDPAAYCGSTVLRQYRITKAGWPNRVVHLDPPGTFTVGAIIVMGTNLGSCDGFVKNNYTWYLEPGT